jgi:hypothetical protein
MNWDEFADTFIREAKQRQPNTSITKKNLYDFFGQEMYQGKMKHIIKIKSIFPLYMSKTYFWEEWVPKNLYGNLVCLSSDDNHEEWWGFECKEDAMKVKLIWG